MRGDKLMKVAAETLNTTNSVYIGKEINTQRKKHKFRKGRSLICLLKKQFRILYRKPRYIIFTELAAGNLKILAGMFSYEKSNCVLFENKLHNGAFTLIEGLEL